MKMYLGLLLGLVACSGCRLSRSPLSSTWLRRPILPRRSSRRGPGTPNITMDNSCDGWFTLSGLNCVNCPDQAACLDTVDVVYCASGGPGCQDDPACVYIKEGDEDPSGAKKSKRKATRPIKKIASKLKPGKFRK
jgi:hypothetical protein